MKKQIDTMCPECWEPLKIPEGTHIDNYRQWCWSCNPNRWVRTARIIMFLILIVAAVKAVSELLRRIG